MSAALSKPCICLMRHYLTSASLQMTYHLWIMQAPPAKGPKSPPLMHHLNLHLSMPHGHSTMVIMRPTLHMTHARAPVTLPFPCTPENNDRMKAWLLARYSSSTFNMCPRRALPCMEGPSIKMHVDATATPKACHTPANIPLHW